MGRGILVSPVAQFIAPSPSNPELTARTIHSHVAPVMRMSAMTGIEHDTWAGAFLQISWTSSSPQGEAREIHLSDVAQYPHLT